MMQPDIHALLGKFFSGQASAEENIMVKEWADASEENKADFQLLEKLWTRAGEQEPVVFDTAAAWQQVHITLQETKRPAKTIRLFSLKAMTAAAALVLLIGAWWIFFASPGRSINTIVAETPIREVLMDDGTKIYLRQGATLAYLNNFGKRRRLVTLTGEAFFDVAHDTGKPFVIAAVNSLVQVVGTSFMVNADSGQVRLHVKTGRVYFSDIDDVEGRILVAAGEKALLKNNNLSKEINSDINFNAWQTKQLAFNNTPLRTVVQDINHYYRVNVSINPQDSARIGATTFSARFNDQPLASVLNELSAISTYIIKSTGNNQFVISLK